MNATATESVATNWNGPAYRGARYGTLEYWQYRAACVIDGSTRIPREETDRTRLEVGRVAYEHLKEHGWSNVWHACFIYFGWGRCNCARCQK